MVLWIDHFYKTINHKLFHEGTVELLGKCFYSCFVHNPSRSLPHFTSVSDADELLIPFFGFYHRVKIYGFYPFLDMI